MKICVGMCVLQDRRAGYSDYKRCSANASAWRKKAAVDRALIFRDAVGLLAFKGS